HGPGVDPVHDPTVMDRGGVAAVVSRVRVSALREYGRRLQDGDAGPIGEWVGAHQRVLATTLPDGPVLPVRFGTVVAGRAEVEELLQRLGPEIREAIERFRGRTEWGVKVVASSQQVRAALEATDRGE